MAAPAWIQRTKSSSNAAGGTFTPTMPSGIVAGNLLVLSFFGYDATTAGCTISTPSGWTLAASTVTGYSNACRGSVFYKVAAASNPAPTFTGLFDYVLVEVSEIGPVGATPVSASVSGVNSSGATIPTPASTAAAADSLVVWLAFEMTGSPSPSYTTFPSGSTSRYNEAGAGISLCQAWADKPVAAGAVAADSFTRTVTTYNAVAHTLVIAPLATPSGSFTKVKWGTGLTVTDEGSGVIRVDVVP